MEALATICKHFHTNVEELRDMELSTQGRKGLRRARQFLCWYYRSKGLSLYEVRLLTNIPEKTIGSHERSVLSLIRNKDLFTLKLIAKL